jgi:hypothetical protein
MKDENKFNITEYSGKNYFYCVKCFKKILEKELSEIISLEKRKQYNYLLELIKLNSK